MKGDPLYMDMHNSEAPVRIVETAIQRCVYVCMYMCVCCLCVPCVLCDPLYMNMHNSEAPVRIVGTAIQDMLVYVHICLCVLLVCFCEMLFIQHTHAYKHIYIHTQAGGT